MNKLKSFVIENPNLMIIQNVGVLASCWFMVPALVIPASLCLITISVIALKGK